MSKELNRKLFQFLNTNLSGVLSTQSAAMPQYPFGSAITYCLDNDGNLITLISHLAEHTKNLIASKNASLCVAESLDPTLMHNQMRVTLVGDATILKDPTEYVKERYFGLFPKQRNYLRIGGFEFYRMKVSRVRFIGGFGDVQWFDYNHQYYSFTWGKDAGSVLKHMTEDHGDVVNKAGQKLGLSGKCQIVAVDSIGFHIRAESQVGFLPFDEECNQAENLRDAFIKISSKLKS
jgi:heme iron utilization protein